jgi:hypothetical protein
MNFNKAFKTGTKVWLLFACKPVIAQNGQILHIYDAVTGRLRGDSTKAQAKLFCVFFKHGIPAGHV